MPQQKDSNPSPVTVGRQPSVASPLLERIQRDASLGYRYTVFNISLEGRRYQVIGLLSYSDPFREHPKAAFGFMVDLEWARQNYFPELVRQVSGIGSKDARLALMILDAQGDVVVNARPGVTGEPVGRRQFPTFFFDRRIVAATRPQGLDRESWTVQAVVSQDPTLIAANTGARRTLAIVSVTTIVLALGILLTAHGIRKASQLAEMQSTFVSTVTHELKTPLALIQAVSQTFATERGITPEITRKHGRLALHEVKRLRRLIDNLLAYARITDVTEAYTFEPVDLSELVDATLHDFASQLEYSGFDVQVDIPADLPAVRADRPALGLALGNLVDNAMRYSRERRQLRIDATWHGSTFVALNVSDEGTGIAADELPKLTKRFYRGRRAEVGGTGLGLAIVDRIVSDHRGILSFRSAVGEGTTVTIQLRAARESA
jgi:signal transduction histidine kinase